MPGIWDITVSAAFMGMCLPDYHTARIYLCFGVYTETIAWFIFARCMLVPIPKALHRENTGQNDLNFNDNGIEATITRLDPFEEGNTL